MVDSASSMGWCVGCQNSRPEGEVGTGGAVPWYKKSRQWLGVRLVVRGQRGRDLNSSKSAAVAGPGGGIVDVVELGVGRLS